MQQAKKHGIDGGEQSPAVGDEDLFQLGQCRNFCHLAGGKVGHEHDGDDDFIGRQAKDKSEQNDAVKSKIKGKGVEKAGDMQEKAGLANGDVRQ